MVVTPVNPASWEVEAGKIVAGGSPSIKFMRPPSQPIK
jgi:hypothetical protein